MSFSVSIEYVKKQRKRPPSVNLFFDVVLQNEADVPYWFVLPDKVFDVEDNAFSVFALDRYELGRDENVHVLRCRGRQGFFAIPIASQCKITLQNLPVSAFGNIPTTIELPVLVAETIQVGDEVITAWLDNVTLVNNENLSVDASTMATQRDVVYAYKTDDWSERPVTLPDCTVLSQTIALQK